MLSQNEMNIRRLFALQAAAVMVFEQSQQVVLVSADVAFRAIEQYVQQFPSGMVAAWLTQARCSDEEQALFTQNWTEWQDMVFGQGE